MLASFQRVLALVLVIPGPSAFPLRARSAQDAIERGTPWYWPVGSPFEPGRIRQGYGQYETVGKVVAGFKPHEVYGAHEGLDIAATLDDWVRAPIAGTVLGILCPATSCPEGSSTTSDPYGSVILAAESGDWGLTVTHLYDIAVAPDDPIEKGQALGRVVEWADIPEFEHVHLTVFAPQPATPYGPRVSVGDPLVFLGGRSDTHPPDFLDIEDGADSYWPVAFADDVPVGTALTFHGPDALPQRQMDILAHVNDHFSTLVWSSSAFEPIAGLVAVVALADLFPLAGIRMDLFALPISKVAPARLSVRITREADGKRVFQSTVEFTGEVSDAAYLEPDGTPGRLASSGWPDPDFYFFLTHSEAEPGAWDASDPDVGGTGTYTVEVTAEDAAGNIAYASTSVEVVSP